MSVRALRPNYLLVGIWLAGLMLLGVILSECTGHGLPLPHWGLASIVLTLSTVKAALVALYFMHLQSDRRLLALVALFPFVLIVLALSVVFASALFHF